MIGISNSQIPPPENWQDFETLCWDLWKSIWGDPETQKNGRQGQPQHGVDIYGRPDEGTNWAGIQCKGKDNYSNRTITKTELEEEVEKAKTFAPRLSKFIVATTGQRDQKIQTLAREITEKHREEGLFSVRVSFWDDIRDLSIEHQEVFERHYEHLYNAKTNEKMKEYGDKITSSISLVDSKVDKLSLSVQDVANERLASEHQAELDQIRESIKENNPTVALKYLGGLKNRVWLNTTPVVQYRILTHEGAANLHLNRYHEAGKKFIEALQYNPDDEKSIENAAFGHLLLGESSTAKKLAFNVLNNINPTSSRAYSIIIQAASSDEEIKKVISEIPEYVKETQDVAHVIGNYAYNKGDLNRAKKWLEISIKNEIENIPDIRALLGSALLQMVLTDHTTIPGYQLNAGQKELLTRSIGLFTHSWNTMIDLNLQKLHTHWLVNRGIAKRLLNDHGGYKRDIGDAFNLDSSNPTNIYFKALSEFENGEYENAIHLLKDILGVTEQPGVLSLYIESLRKSEKFENAINEINKFLGIDICSDEKEKLYKILINIYLDLGDYGEAQKICETRLKEDPANIQRIVDLSRVMRRSGNTDEAISILNNSKNEISESSTTQDLVELADEFFALELFDEARSIYEKFVDITQSTELTYRIVESYYRCGEIGKALMICKSLRGEHGPIPHISQIEAAIDNEIGDLSEARKVYEEYLKKFPDDFGIKLELAVLNLRCDNLDVVDEFLKSRFDIDSLSFENSAKIAHLFGQRGLVKKYIEILYETRRKFFDNNQAHRIYIGAILNNENEEWLDRPTRVAADTVVWIEDQSGEAQHHIIENRKDADMRQNELGICHSLSQKLLGESVGDTISYTSPVSEEIRKISRIENKYIYAFQESLNRFNQLFPKIKDLVIKNSNRNKNILEYYQNRKLTVGAVANLIQKNVFYIWSDLIKSSDLGIYCTGGSAEERKHASSLIKRTAKLIIDPISLATIIELKVGDIIIDNFGKLGVAQSTVDIIKDAIIGQKGIRPKSFMSPGKGDENVILHDVSPESVHKTLKKFEEMLSWVRTNCEIVPCKAALNMKRSQKIEYDSQLGQSFIDTILIASQSGNILYSDDGLLRAVAKEPFNAEGVWTQILLMDCVNRNALEKGKYNKMIIDLVNLHYHHTSINSGVLTSINSGVLVEAAKEANWKLEYPFTDVLDILSEKHSDEPSAFNVSVDFTSSLWKERIQKEDRNWLFLNLLTTLTTGRRTPQIIRNFKDCIMNRFDLSQIDRDNIVELIGLWELIYF
jgi:tetratricopeptide (TPR) repeat protein